jgi:hypothetical protein
MKEKRKNSSTIIKGEYSGGYKGIEIYKPVEGTGL